jgi:hypothetical protein
MKAFLTTLLAILCGGILLWGNIHWNNKTTISASEPKSDTVQKEPTKQREANNVEKVKNEPEIISYTKNWPTEAVETFKQAQEEGRPYRILLTGSSALGEEPAGWAYQTKEELIKTYSENNVSIEILKYEKTSLQVVQEEDQDEIAAANADLVIFEPFTLNDNTFGVGAENSHINIETIIETIKEINPDTFVILQPPNPIYNAKYYPVQVEALKEFAGQNDIPYLDHWTAWPDPATTEINDYLTNGEPNEKGHQLWAEYIIDYLITKN